MNMKKTKGLALSLIAATTVLLGAGTASAGTVTPEHPRTPIFTLQPGTSCSSPGFGCPRDSGWQEIKPPAAK
ncbi:hypothetical protein ACIRBY_15750 [Streptomyces sp. NPDC096136]|uniref:hypothetical protein n=1 Tax=Streptomyces sp. NPDC096136 TaxID=3366076 RepID=UPI0037F7BC64